LKVGDLVVVLQPYWGEDDEDIGKIGTLKEIIIRGKVSGFVVDLEQDRRVGVIAKTITLASSLVKELI
jgi:hypothetical protein